MSDQPPDGRVRGWRREHVRPDMPVRAYAWGFPGGVPGGVVFAIDYQVDFRDFGLHLLSGFEKQCRVTVFGALALQEVHKIGVRNP